MLDGEAAIENAPANAETVATNLVQLPQSNSVKRKRRCNGFLKHSKSIEPLFPVKVGLLVHAKSAMVAT